MIPIRDNIPAERSPVVNYTLIALCSVAFLFQLAAGDRGQAIVEQFGFVPLRLTNPDVPAVIEQSVPYRTPRGIVVQRELHPLAPAVIPAWATLFTCMFLHGGWMHFLGNMWFLYIFGDNVEDRLGKLGYLALYLVTGLGAGASHLISGPESPVPTIGASGAIAGVMGAYLWLYPKASVLAVIPLFIFIQAFVVPAWVFLGVWFALQLFQGIGSVAAAGGVAWWAHIGGFVLGALIAIVIGRTPLGHESVEARRFPGATSARDALRIRGGERRF